MIYLTTTAVSETTFVVDFIDEHAKEYDLNNLTGKNTGDNLNVYSGHPLSMITGDSLGGDDDNYTTILPGIGVELVGDSEDAKQSMGRQSKPFIVTQEWIDDILSVNIQDRIRSGFPVSNEIMAQIQAEFTTKNDAGGDLIGIKQIDIHSQTLNVACWATDRVTADLIYRVVRGLLKRLRFVVSSLGVKNMKVNGNSSFYNYDYDRTLHGGEFTIDWTQNITEIIIDPSLNTLKDVKLINKIIPENKDEPGLSPVKRGG
jgi:hypothetical protein